jgi:uncharacterized protein YkwD
VARTLALAGTSLLGAVLLSSWTPSTTTAWNQSAAEGTLWQLLNGTRANNGLRVLKQSGTMVSLARWRSKDMIQRDYFSHDVLGSGYQVYHWYDLNGVNYKLGGENIGWNNGYSDADSPVAIHNGFMNSPGHRANILNPVWTHGGVGAYGTDNVNYLGKLRNPRMYTELFYQSAGSTTSAPPPPPASTPKPKPKPTAPPPPPPSRGGTTPVASTPTPSDEAQAETVSVAIPVRPNSTAKLDGTKLLIAGQEHAWTAQFLRSMTGQDGRMHPPTELASADRAPESPYRVEAASAAQTGFFESVLGSLLGLFLG